MSYRNSFITVASDCPVDRAVTPPERNGKKTVARLQHDLLAAAPYALTHEDLLYEVFVRHKAFAPGELAVRGAAIREELFRRKHPCMRASPLPKQYGWGVHFDAHARMAILAVESDGYRAFASAAGEGAPTVIAAIRNRRA